MFYKPISIYLCFKLYEVLEHMKNRTAFITGATSGIGYAIAELFAFQGIKLILCGRRSERLEELTDKLEKQTEIKTLIFDVRDKEEIEKQINNLEESWQNIDILVNNAGNAHGLAPIQEGSVEDWDAMIDINVKGLLYVTKQIIPLMKSSEHPQIINIGSIAGKEVYPNGNVYCASKFAVDALNQAMRIDLNQLGFRVSAINPGLVETEFSKVRFKGDEEKAQKVYEGYTPLTAKDIAEIALFMVTRPKHVNIADMLVLATDQASAGIVNKKTI